MRDSKRFERGFPPLAKEGQGGFERASAKSPSVPLFQRGKLLSRRTIIFGLGLRGRTAPLTATARYSVGAKRGCLANQILKAPSCLTHSGPEWYVVHVLPCHDVSELAYLASRAQCS